MFERLPKPQKAQPPVTKSPALPTHKRIALPLIASVDAEQYAKFLEYVSRSPKSPHGGIRRTASQM